jgi:hypothetical protein
MNRSAQQISSPDQPLSIADVVARLRDRRSLPVAPEGPQARHPNASNKRIGQVTPAAPSETRRGTAPFEVDRNGGGTSWTISAGDIDAWTPDHQLIWVTTDTSQNPVYKSGSSKELWRVDCEAKTQALELSLQFDRSGRLTNRYQSKGAAMLEIIPGSPVDKVRRAFCPPAFE